MEAAAKRDERLIDRATAQAWQTAIFALNGYGGKLQGKSLSDYLINKPPKRRSTTADAVAFFSALKEAGYPIKVERVPWTPYQSRPQ